MNEKDSKFNYENLKPLPEGNFSKPSSIVNCQSLDLNTINNEIKLT